MSREKSESSYIVASVDRALQLLLLLGKQSRELGVTELSKMLGVQKSTVHSLLQTLLQRGFVQQTETGRYTLGVRLIELGSRCADRLDIRAAARSIMVELANETQEIALLAVLAASELVIVEKVEPQKPFLIIPKFDFTMAVHSTGVGKVLLAYAPVEVVDTVIKRGLERFTPFTLTDEAALYDELKQVRQQGYAVGCDETIEGITCIAVPVFGRDGEVKAALSISSASSILTNDKYKDVIGILTTKAKAISLQLGYLPELGMGISDSNAKNIRGRYYGQTCF